MNDKMRIYADAQAGRILAYVSARCLFAQMNISKREIYMAALVDDADLRRAECQSCDFLRTATERTLRAEILRIERHSGGLTATRCAAKCGCNHVRRPWPRKDSCLGVWGIVHRRDTGHEGQAKTGKEKEEREG
jgi:hypothetical protein